ncbi:hypothetical protein C8J27_11060 [Rhodobacter aestuarii]|uniref:Uncharacterized protein n=1 Tax=Rhodobacter aestuarii TaxID=453582 RepID=A0A1N7Q0Z9_9RHOB|nr:hypothetical protein [Rhodobacter aestuarii]PTV94009.1 hypothetical protein C8J27_11060 [Rhodobacter aestuarii]SIT16495.1 hypothetical protein SAMN05421580_11260 [Rhodobacter aestuarii]
MAYNATKNVPKHTMTPLSSGPVTALRAQLTSGAELELLVTTIATAPADRSGAVTLYPHVILPLDTPLSALWAEASSGVYVWGYSLVDCIVSVNHA